MDDFTDKSYWLTTRPYQPGPALDHDLDVDVAIIGAGFTGLTTAYFLRLLDPTLRVAVLESQVVGYGASGRNAGFSMTKIGMLNSLTKVRFGGARATQAHHYADVAVTLVKDLVASLGLDCDYQHVGLLTVATSQPYARRLDKELDLVADLGLGGIERLTEDEVADRVDSPIFVGPGWWEPNCGILNPAKLAWAWRDVVAAAGADVFEHTPVTSVVRSGGRSLVQTPRGRVTASKVVFATNAWSHQFAELRGRQVPVWTYIVMTEPLNDRQKEAIGWQGREGIEDFRDLVHYYRLTVDDRLVFGGRDVGLWDRRTMERDRDESVFAGLRADLLATFPALEGIRFTHAWGGPVSATLDLFPALGYVGGRDWVSSFGCVGHGVSTTHLHGRTIADLVLEADTELTRTFFVNRSVVPFPPGPLMGPVMSGIAGFMRWEDRRLDVLPW